MQETVPLNQEGYKIAVIFAEDGAAIDISSASVKQIKVTKPNGTETAYAATFETTGTDGNAYYKTVAGDLSAPGWYKFRGYVEMGTFKGHTMRGRFLVEA